MKKTLKFLTRLPIIIFLLLLNFSTLNAQWVTQNREYNGRLNRLDHKSSTQSFTQNSLSTDGVISCEAVYFTDANTGTVLWMGSGNIYRTIDGGLNWIDQRYSYTEVYNDVFFTNANTGTVVGNSGIILRTTNGGVNWYAQTSGTTSDLNSVAYINNWGIVVGANDKVFGTGNGGATWFEYSIPISSSTLVDVSYVDLNHATAVGSNGTILCMTNGFDWYVRTSGTTQNLNGVSFTDANTGTVVGNGGTILRTTDGGVNWYAQTSGTTQNLNGVSFTDANAGTVVGNGGTILRTTDGGVNWYAQTNGTTDITPKKWTQN